VLQDATVNWRNPRFTQTDAHPVVCVTWHDAVEFCKWLSKKEGRTYRLPTEAEWEYACRAGAATRYACGNYVTDLNGHANVADLSLAAEFPKVDLTGWTVPWNDGHPFTAPVGSFKANAFGLYDMHGNAWEWCADWFDADYYKQSPRRDPPGPTTGTERVARGGSFRYHASYCRSANRGHCDPKVAVNECGFRVVCSR
jgi:formylglycine-generating enzyme required for sulfatase activity